MSWAWFLLFKVFLERVEGLMILILQVRRWVIKLRNVMFHWSDLILIHLLLFFSIILWTKHLLVFPHFIKFICSSLHLLRLLVNDLINELLWDLGISFSHIRAFSSTSFTLLDSLLNLLHFFLHFSDPFVNGLGLILIIILGMSFRLSVFIKSILVKVNLSLVELIILVMRRLKISSRQMRIHMKSFLEFLWRIWIVSLFGVRGFGFWGFSLLPQSVELWSALGVEFFHFKFNC